MRASPEEPENASYTEECPGISLVFSGRKVFVVIILSLNTFNVYIDISTIMNALRSTVTTSVVDSKPR